MKVRSQRAGLLVAVCGVFLALSAPAQTSVVYKGLFAPGTLIPTYNFSMDDTEKLKQDGFNFANVSPFFAVNNLGNVTQCTCDADIEAKILEYHTNNIAVTMIPILAWTKSITNCPITNSPNLLPVMATTLVHDLEYLVHMTNMARLAEEYCVDVFAPYNEPEMGTPHGYSPSGAPMRYLRGCMSRWHRAGTLFPPAASLTHPRMEKA
jgi:hypothetical protein